MRNIDSGSLRQRASLSGTKKGRRTFVIYRSVNILCLLFLFAVRFSFSAQGRDTRVFVRRWLLQAVLPPPSVHTDQTRSRASLGRRMDAEAGPLFVEIQKKA